MKSASGCESLSNPVLLFDPDLGTECLRLHSAVSLIFYGSAGLGSGGSEGSGGAVGSLGAVGSCAAGCWKGCGAASSSSLMPLGCGALLTTGTAVGRAQPPI